MLLLVDVEAAGPLFLLFFIVMRPALFEWPLWCWFEWPPLVFWHNYSYFFNCNMVLCLYSLIFSINSWHFSNSSCPILTFSLFIHVLIKLLHTSIVLFVCLTLSSISCFLAFCMILIPLSVLMFLFNCKLTRVVFWLIHQRVNPLWFLKSTSFITCCSQSLNMATLSLLNSFSIRLCRFLILFMLCLLDLKSLFLYEQNKYLL